MEINQIFLKQKKIISILKNFIKKNKNIDFYILKEFYYSSWSHCLGYLKIKEILYKKNFIFKLKIFFLNIYLQFLFSDLKKIQIKNFYKKKFNKIVLSWCYKKDFEDNIYTDRYFLTSSKEAKDTLWLLISMDGYSTNKIDNVIIFNTKISIIKFLKFIIISTLNSLIKFDLNNYYVLENFYIELNKEISFILNNQKIKKFILPYEGQVFQNYILKTVNQKKIIETVGYVHSALPPLPSEYIKRPGSPKKIIVHGNLQKQIMLKNLGWKNKDIVCQKSARYIYKDKKNFQNTIFIPMTFEDEKLLLIYLENFLKKQHVKSLTSLRIKNHPLMYNSKKHLKFIKNINLLLRKYKNRFNKNINIHKSIFFSATASIIEALEYGIEIIHIVNDPIMEVHNPKIWKFIKTKKIDENIYKYKLSKKKSCINFREKNFNFSNWITK